MDRDIDDVMSRTRLRPIPSGRMHAISVLAFGVALAVFATWLLGHFVNVLTAALALVGWVMDLGWKGQMLNGSRFYDLDTWRNGVLVVALCALIGAIGSWWIHETRCRNVWKPA